MVIKKDFSHVLKTVFVHAHKSLFLRKTCYAVIQMCSVTCFYYCFHNFSFQKQEKKERILAFNDIWLKGCTKEEPTTFLDWVWLLVSSSFANCNRQYQTFHADRHRSNYFGICIPCWYLYPTKGYRFVPTCFC